mmetsp:Transcript_4848/g.12478  ORF Transcript_4848/g.12478 Transcript_4848/m.12478 type:complete len:277 (-) Transcript_4848:406-1236(-)
MGAPDCHTPDGHAQRGRPAPGVARQPHAADGAFHDGRPAGPLRIGSVSSRLGGEGRLRRRRGPAWHDDECLGNPADGTRPRPRRVRRDRDPVAPHKGEARGSLAERHAIRSGSAGWIPRGGCRVRRRQVLPRRMGSRLVRHRNGHQPAAPRDVLRIDAGGAGGRAGQSKGEPPPAGPAETAGGGCRGLHVRSAAGRQLRRRHLHSGDAPPEHARSPAALHRRASADRPPPRANTRPGVGDGTGLRQPATVRRHGRLRALQRPAQVPRQGGRAGILR